MNIKLFTLFVILNATLVYGMAPHEIDSQTARQIVLRKADLQDTDGNIWVFDRVQCPPYRALNMLKVKNVKVARDQTYKDGDKTANYFITTDRGLCQMIFKK